MASTAKKLDKYSELQAVLQKELPLHGARIKFMVLIITALIKVRSVNYQRLVEGFDNDVCPCSILRRIQRFFASFDLDGDLIARLLFKMLPVQGKLQLTLDRTNWKFGSKNINILMLGVIYQGVALPILWSFIGDKRGNSSQKERVKLLERYIALFGVESIDFLTADREFIGQEWWEFLILHRIRFFIRVRDNLQVFVPSKGTVKAFWLFNFLKLNTAHCHPKIVRIGKNLVYLSGLRFVNQEGKLEFLIVATLRPDQQVIALKTYRKRWQIETMFRAFKSGGFHLEDTHLTDYERLNKLLLITALAFVWTYKVGIYRNDTLKKIAIKKHGRLAKSIFAYGLEFLAHALINHLKHKVTLCSNFFLSCT